MKTNLVCRTVATAVSLLGSFAAWGDFVTLEFGGKVTSVYNPVGAVPSSLIQVGDPVQISVRYDTTTPDYRPDANWAATTAPGGSR